MKKAIHSFVHNKRDVMAAIVLPIMVMALAYCVLLVISLIFNTHQFLLNFRTDSFFYIFCAGAIVRVKVEAVEAGLLKNKIIGTILDLPLNFLVWTAFLLMMFFYLPALALVLVLANFWGKSPQIEKFIIGVVYFLANTSLFVLGAPITIEGAFPEEDHVACMQHGSFIEYFTWPVIMGLGLSKIIAGKNLVKWPVVGHFIDVRSLIIDRDDLRSPSDVLLKVKALLKLGYRICWGPGAGRDRLSDGGEMKKFKTGIFKILDDTILVVPVLSIGAMEYKPAMKGEIVWKKLSFFKKIYAFFAFQFFCSFRKIHVIIMEGIRRLENETTEAFADRVYAIMNERQKLETAKLLRR